MLYEQFGLDHELGSSFGPSRIIRRVYPDDLYTGLMARSYELWDELEQVSGETLRLRCGGIYFGVEVQDAVDSLAAAAVPHEVLSAAEASYRYPHLRFRNGETIVYEPTMGSLDASLCVRTQVRMAQSHGAELREETRVREIRPVGDGLDIDGEPFDAVVVTAGAWTPCLVPGLPLHATLQQQAFFTATDPSAFSPSVFPVWIDADTEIYGFPLIAASVKVAGHEKRRQVDPDNLERLPDEAYFTALREYLSWRIPGLPAQPSQTKTCLYTVAPHDDFMVDRLPGFSRGVFASACSGHGFKFSILTGKMLADMILSDSEPPGRFRASWDTAISSG